MAVNHEPRVLRLLGQRWVAGDPPLTEEPENSGLEIVWRSLCNLLLKSSVEVVVANVQGKRTYNNAFLVSS